MKSKEFVNKQFKDSILQHLSETNKIKFEKAMISAIHSNKFNNKVFEEFSRELSIIRDVTNSFNQKAE